MSQWHVKFRIITENRLLVPSEMTVSAPDRTGAMRIIESMYGARNVNIVNIIKQ